MKTILKHLKYKKDYQPDTVYWGLGIENEVYLELSSKRVNKLFLTNTKRERYSIDYFSNYKNDLTLKKYISLLSDFVTLPILLNSHTFLNTDHLGNSKTLYTKSNEPNPQFIGKTLIETLQEYDTFFKNNNSWLFDGDTIEFTTNNFFNVTLEEILNELNDTKTEFTDRLNKRLNNVKIMEKNYPFAIYLTNKTNVSMFNNGTLHYNITLPTKLNSESLIEDFDTFKNVHCKAIRIIQWMEPFLISIYGSPDPLSVIDERYSKCSQRCAVSRYIGIGTYNTETMKTGKIMTTETKPDWYKTYYKFNGYTELKEIGMDINFNKHHNHGIELRFLDHLSSEKISESFEFIIYLMDYTFKKSIENPVKNKVWNELVVNVMKNGKYHVLTKNEKKEYTRLFGKISGKTVIDIYYSIYSKLLLRYNKLIKMKNYNELAQPLVGFTNSDKFSAIGPFSKLALQMRNKNDYTFLKLKRTFSCFN